MTYIIQAIYKAEAMLEISVDVNGNNYLVIYGNHVNGGFCCIPNWGYACEMGDPSDTFYNAESLTRCKMAKSCAKAIAEAICEAYMSIPQSLRCSDSPLRRARSRL